MALSSGAISRVRGLTSEIRSTLTSLRAEVSTLSTSLKSNDNFQTFVEGTEKGLKEQQRLDKTTGLLDQELTAQTTNLLSRINTFLSRQEELNRRAAAAAAAAARAKQI